MLKHSTRLIPVAALTALTISATGCGVGSAAKQMLHEVRGAQTEIMLISTFQPDTLTRFKSVSFDPATTTVGTKLCPPKLMSSYNEFAAELPGKLTEVYPGGSPALRVSSEIEYFQPKGLFSGALCLIRVKMRDSADGRTVVDAMVLTESKSFRASGRSDIAESAVKGIGKFLEKQEAPKEGLLDEL